jgi:CHASE2 domain-containing sensor protein
LGTASGLGANLAAGLLLSLLFLRVVDSPPVEELQLRLFDLFQLLELRIPAVIVDSDDASLYRLGRWAWPRTRSADLIFELARLGALAIAFDVVPLTRTRAQTPSAKCLRAAPFSARPFRKRESPEWSRTTK